MSRHNRRRTRGGHKAKHIRAHTDQSYDPSLAAYGNHSLHGLDAVSPWGGSGYFAYGTDYRDNSAAVSSRRTYSSNALPRGRVDSGTLYPVPSTLWTLRGSASQTFEARKRQMFGEADGSGEDEGLCAKMMEYFGKLDFIDL